MDDRNSDIALSTEFPSSILYSDILGSFSSALSSRHAERCVVEIGLKSRLDISYRRLSKCWS